VSTLEQFAENLHQEVLTLASEEGAEALLPSAFTRLMIERVIESGDLEDGLAVRYYRTGVEVSGYAVSEDETTLDLFVTVYRGICPPGSLTRTDLDAAQRRLHAFYERARDGRLDGIEEASPASDLVKRIRGLRDKTDTVRFFVFTDACSRVDYRPAELRDGVEFSHHIWDIERLQRFTSSGRPQEEIEIDFVEMFGAPIPCLDGGSDATNQYRALLAIFPGKVLNDVYARYGARLLELNVRSFLSARGKVNKGIRDTLLTQPDRFLAYNNGISATASHVEMGRTEDGGLGILKVKDLQIVNGAQTTASLHHAARREGADLADVRVQAKLTVVPPESIGELVPLISRYSNSQNKVSEADFSANDDFHVNLQKMSRSIWAPASDGVQLQTRWFYERARGQYQDELSRSGTKAKQNLWKRQHPTNQKFTKTDVAKFENTWFGLPHIVSRGAQKNFVEFTLRPPARRKHENATNYFEHLVAKAKLFRETDIAVRQLRHVGYGANVVTYTLALLVFHREVDLDLSMIWATQKVPQEVTRALTLLSEDVRAVLIDAPGGGNVTEWAKKVECWEKVKQIPKSRIPRVRDGGRGGEIEALALANQAKKEAQRDQLALARVPAGVWDNLTAWSRETGELTIRQREVGMLLSIAAERHKPPPPSIVDKGWELLEAAATAGFANAASYRRP
jgi:hypothetical protein